MVKDDKTSYKIFSGDQLYQFKAKVQHLADLPYLHHQGTMM
jgi:hypothetical protein